MHNLSVLFPFRNAQEHIAESVKSLNGQSALSYCVIALNDGSTDDSEAILRDTASFDYTLLWTNGIGLAGALNEGLKLVKTEFVARMDSDDISYPERFQRQLEYLTVHRAVDFLGTQAEVISVDGRRTGKRIAKPVCYENVYKYMKYASPIVHPTLMARTGALKELNGYENLNPGQDYELIANALLAGYRVENLADVLLGYRDHPAGQSRVNRLQTICIGNAIRSGIRKRDLRSERVSRLLQGCQKIGATEEVRRQIRNRDRAIDLMRDRRLVRKCAGVVGMLGVMTHMPVLVVDALRGWRASRIVRLDIPTP